MKTLVSLLALIVITNGKPPLPGTDEVSVLIDKALNSSAIGLSRPQRQLPGEGISAPNTPETVPPTKLIQKLEFSDNKNVTSALPFCDYPLHCGSGKICEGDVCQEGQYCCKSQIGICCFPSKEASDPFYKVDATEKPPQPQERSVKIPPTQTPPQKVRSPSPPLPQKPTVPSPPRPHQPTPQKPHIKLPLRLPIHGPPFKVVIPIPIPKHSTNDSYIYPLVIDLTALHPQPGYNPRTILIKSIVLRPAKPSEYPGASVNNSLPVQLLYQALPQQPPHVSYRRQKPPHASPYPYADPRLHRPLNRNPYYPHPQYPVTYKQAAPPSAQHPLTYTQPAPPPSQHSLTYTQPAPPSSQHSLTYTQPAPPPSQHSLTYTQPAPPSSQHSLTYTQPAPPSSQHPLTYTQPAPPSSQHSLTYTQPAPSSSQNPVIYTQSAPLPPQYPVTYTQEVPTLTDSDIYAVPPVYEEPEPVYTLPQELPQPTYEPTQENLPPSYSAPYEEPVPTYYQAVPTGQEFSINPMTGEMIVVPRQPTRSYRSYDYNPVYPDLPYYYRRTPHDPFFTEEE